jgi:hypothetical protein
MTVIILTRGGRSWNSLPRRQFVGSAGGAALRSRRMRDGDYTPSQNLANEPTQIWNTQILAGRPGFNYRRGQWLDFFLLTTAFRHFWDLPSLLISWYQGLFPRGSRDQCAKEVKNAWRYTSTPPFVCVHGMAFSSAVDTFSWHQKSHGTKFELNSVFGLEKVDRWNPIRTSSIQSRPWPMQFLGFSNHEKGALRQEISKWSTVCSTFSRNGWSVVRSASLAKGGTTAPPQSSDSE